MNKIFSPDSLPMRIMSRIADLIILNLLFLAVSIPVVTIGPALTALYTVLFAMGTEREHGVFLAFCQAFRQNFLPALKAWLIILAVTAMLVLDIVLMSQSGGMMAMMNIAFAILLVVELLAAGVCFPLLSRFANTTLESLKNSIVIALASLPRAAGVLILWAFPWAVLVRYPMVFFTAGILWLMIYFSAAAYLTTLLLKPVFAPYLSEEEEKA